MPDLNKKEQNEHDKKNGLRAMFKLMKPYIIKHKWSLLTVILLVICSNMLLLYIPKVTGQIIDAVSLGENHVDFSSIIKSGVIILALSLIGWLSECIRNILMNKVAQSIVFDLRQTVFSHLIRLPISFIESNMKGELMSRISQDVDNISETISTDIISLFTSAVTVVIAFIMMLQISPYLTLIFAVIVPVMMVTARFISRKARLLFRRKKASFSALYGHAEEMLTANKTVKLFGMQDYNETEYNRLSEECRNSGTKAEFFSSTMMPTMNALNSLSFAAISIFGCILLLMGKISLGNISSFIIYSKKFTSPIVETANLYNTIQSALVSCERIYFLLNHEKERDIGKIDAPKSVKGNVTFDSVCFSYVKDTPVLTDLSFSVKSGERVAIVGATGSGKTTITNLLLRFYEAQSGKITIDGMDINEIPLSTLRRYFALVLQDNFLFEASVIENVDYGGETGDIERIKKAIHEVDMEDYVLELPHRFKTVLSETNDTMSQGQKQLLTIARILLTDTSMLIFDEATSSVDTKTEQKIKAVTQKLMEGKTSFIIAHRLSTILNCDLILLINDGKLVECGTHMDLMKAKGAYYNMYQSQFK